MSPAKSNFSSPDYPNGFPVNLTCGWFITAPENHFVKLTLTSRLSFSSSSKDSVEVYDVDGSELTDISLNLNYNKATDTVYSKFRSLYVVFKSDDKPRTALWAEEGIFVSYTAIEIGKIDFPLVWFVVQILESSVRRRLGWYTFRVSRL